MSSRVNSFADVMVSNVLQTDTGLNTVPAGFIITGMRPISICEPIEEAKHDPINITGSLYVILYREGSI